MKKYFLTFGDGGANFDEARERICREAAATKQFNEIIGCTWQNVSLEMRATPLRHFKRGAGLWAWKPDIILFAMDNMNEGDVLIYADCGCALSPHSAQWEKLFKRMDKTDVVCHRIHECALQRSRKELLEQFAPSSTHTSHKNTFCYAFEATVICFKKTQFTMQLVREWRQFVLDHPDAVRDVLPAEQSSQLPSFIENRHDQSVFTQLLYKQLANPSTSSKVATVWEFHWGWNLLSNPCIVKARNRCGNAWHISFKQRIVRAGKRVLHALQRLLERHGVCIHWHMRCNYGN